MSRTMRDDAIENDGSLNMARRGRRPQRPAILDEHCGHDDLNAAGDRCLGCGMWAHQFVTGLK